MSNTSKAHCHNQDYYHKDEHVHHDHNHITHTKAQEKILCIRPQSGLSGDMLLCGLASLLDLDNEKLNNRLALLNLPQLQHCLNIQDTFVNHIKGKNVVVTLPHEHAHRNLADIANIIQNSHMNEQAKTLALKTFTLLAEAEGSVHGKKVEEVTFHEVGALDSILDICLSCTLFTELAPDRFICGALPLADGTIQCQHGIISSPAPAVLKLLENVRVCSFSGKGETITPTAIALLKALDVKFNDWPAMQIEKTELIYGGKIFENAPNGSIFALGMSN